MSDLPDLTPVKTFIPTAYAMLEEIERTLLKQLENEQHRFVRPYLPGVDVYKDGHAAWKRAAKERQAAQKKEERRRFIPEPWNLKWLDAHDRARYRAAEEI